MLREESQGSNSGTAVTHDSDPRLLRFELYNRDTGVTTDIGVGPIGLDTAANPAPIPAVPPPPYNPLKLSQLTGGHQDGVPGTDPKINNLTAGDMHVTITCTDSTVISHTLTNAELQALVIAQGQLNQSAGLLDLSSVFPLDSISGKTIDSATGTIVTPYACSMDMNFPASALSFQGTSEGFYGPIVNTYMEGDPFSNGPGMGMVVTPQAFISLEFVMQGTSGTPEASNACVAYIQPPTPTLFDLTLGGFQATITTDDSTPVIVNLGASLSTLQAVAEDLGGGFYRASGAELGWNLTPLVGKNIADVLCSINPGFVGNSKVNLPMSAIGFYHLSDSPPVMLFDLTNTTPVDTPISPSKPYVPTDEWWVYIMLSGPSPAMVPFFFDAATIQANATTQALASDAWVDCIPYGNINWPTSLLAPYIGWNMLGYAVVTYPNSLPGPVDYGPGPFDPTNVLSFSFNGIQNNTGVYDAISTPNGVNIKFYNASGLISAGATMCMQDGAVSPTSWRIATDNSSPEIKLPLLFTEPYELRSRNLPAFYFDISGPTPHSEVPSYNAIMFVSQDGIHWSPCACDITQGYYGNIVHLQDQMTPPMPCNVFEIPNVGGATIIPMKEWTGPWNYIKFMLFADAPSGNPPVRHEQDLAFIYIQIIANAREL